MALQDSPNVSLDTLHLLFENKQQKYLAAFALKFHITATHQLQSLNHLKKAWQRCDWKLVDSLILLSEVQDWRNKSYVIKHEDTCGELLVQPKNCKPRIARQTMIE